MHGCLAGPVEGSPLETRLAHLLEEARLPEDTGRVPEPDADDAVDPWVRCVLEDLPPVGSQERVMVAHAMVARLQAIEAAAIADLAAAVAPGGPAPVVQVDGSLAVPARAQVDVRVVDALAPALCLGRISATRRIADADQLVRALPRTHRLLSDGLVDAGVAAVVVRETSACTEAVAAQVDAALGDALVGMNAGQVRARVVEQVAVVDAAAARTRAAAAIGSRRVEYRPARDGLGELRLVGPAPVLRGLHDALTARAKVPTAAGDADPCAGMTVPARAAGGTDARGLDARRFDTAVGALRHAAPGAGPAPTVEIAVGISTLLGLDEHPGHLSGHGPVPAPVARAWAQRGRLRRFLTDPFTGAVVGVDGHTYPAGTVPPLGEKSAGGDDDRAPCPSAVTNGYRIPADLRRLVTLTAPTCVAPGCSVPAARCDLDHRVPWPAGPTCSCNLAPLCRTHHRMKTHRGWRLRAGPADEPADEAADGVAADQRLPRAPTHHTSRRPDATVTWTSPSGAAYEVAPARRRPAAVTDPAAAAQVLIRRAARRAREGLDPTTTPASAAPTVDVLADRAAASITSAVTWATDPAAPPPF